MALIITVTKGLIRINKKLKKFFSNDEAAMTVATHLATYAKVNFVFGIPACILQVCTYLINIWIEEDFLAAAVSLAYDLSCLGVATGYVRSLLVQPSHTYTCISSMRYDSLK